jgi:MoxR-like ATPase
VPQISALTINQIASLLPNRLWLPEVNESVMLHGPPGVGKSDGVRQIAEESEYTIPVNEEVIARSETLRAIYGQTFTGRVIYDVRLLLCNPTDLKGIPVYDDESGRGTWVMTGMFPESPKGLRDLEDRLILAYDEMIDPRTSVEREFELKRLIRKLEPQVAKALHDQFAIIFLDEITIAPKVVQGAALQLVLDRKSGTYELALTNSIIAAGNTAADRSGATAMSPPLASRFCHYFVAPPSAKEWMDWARRSGQPAETVGFIQFKPDALMEYDPSKMTGSPDAPTTFPCPRTWAKFGRALAHTDIAKMGGDYLMATASGYIGEGMAAVYIGWLTVFHKLPDRMKILTGELKTVDFRKIAHENRHDDDDEKTIRSRALSLKYSFFYSLATDYLKYVHGYLDERAKLRELKQSEDEINRTFNTYSANFLTYVNADPDDIEYGMALISTFLLKDKRAVRIVGDLRKIGEKNSVSNLDRILKGIDMTRDAGNRGQ